MFINTISTFHSKVRPRDQLGDLFQLSRRDRWRFRVRAPVVEVERSCKYILVSSCQQTYMEMHSETVIAKLYELRPEAILTQVWYLEMDSMMLVVFTNFTKICYIFFLIKIMYLLTHPILYYNLFLKDPLPPK